MGGREGTKPRKMAMGKNKIISTLVISVFVLTGSSLQGIRVLASN